MSDLIRTKLLNPHRSDCFAVEAVTEGTWVTPWAFLEVVESRISNGNRAGPQQSGLRWWYARCNDPHCQGAITINEDDLLGAIDA